MSGVLGTRPRTTPTRATPPPSSRVRSFTVQVTGSTVFLVSSLLALAWVAADRPGLPDYFSNDEATISLVARGAYAEADHSFQLIGGFYRELGLASQPILAAVLGLLCYLVGLAFTLSKRSLSVARWTDWMIIVSCVALGAVYHGAFAKDIFTLVVVAGVLLVRKPGIRAEVIPLLAMLAYASIFRTYWFLVAAIYLAIRLTLRLRRGIALLPVLIIVLYVGLAVTFPQLVGVDLDHYREVINEYRTAESVNTLIDRFFTGSGPVVGFLNSVLILLTFIAPVPLILKGGVLYLIVAVLLVALWISLIVAIRSLVVATPPGTNPLNALQQRLFALLAAFLIVQSVFEPDYGSFLRHLTPLLIVAVYLLLSLRQSLTELHTALDLEAP